ncbi:SAM-dependent methyltransferase, partial [Mycobacterium sp. ITM-2017-0098]
GVRQFLMDHFNAVSLVLFDERVFPGVLEEVVLLLADGYAPDGGQGAEHMQLSQVRDADGLAGLTGSRRWIPPANGAKWSAGLMSPAGFHAFDAVVRSDAFTFLEAWGDTTLGMVTGSNRFFTLSPAKVEALGLSEADVLRLSPPGSRHLRGLGLTQQAMQVLGAAGQSTFLFRPAGEPSQAAWHYIRSGEDLDVHEAYK